MSTPAPALSFVATSRNDDHGGDALRRTQSFINRLAEQCQRHQISSELVLVEWNPPQSRAPLADVLAWPAGGEWFSARVLSVPRSLHEELHFAKRQVLFQMIGKNVGIRRALGEYIIATNIDIIFSDELFEWLKSGQIRAGVLYRSDRWDIPNEIQLEPNLDVLLQRARKEHIRRNLCDGIYVSRDGTFVPLFGSRPDELFFEPMRRLLCELRNAIAEQHLMDPEAVLQAIDSIVDGDLPRLRHQFMIPHLHVHACGDFTMMARQDWLALRGYPEWHTYSWNIDSILLFQAHYSGIPVEELGPSRVHYHIEHDYGSGYTPEGGGMGLWTRLAQCGVPVIVAEQYLEILYKLQARAEAGSRTIYNRMDWGLSKHELQCRAMVYAGSSSRSPSVVNQVPVALDFLCGLVQDGPGIDILAGYPGSPIGLEQSSDGGVAEIAVETSPEIYSCAYSLDLTRLLRHSGEYWAKISIYVDGGVVGVGVLSLDRDRFLGDAFTMTGAFDLSAKPNLQEVFVHIPDISEATELVFRNLTPGAQAAHFRLREIQLFREDAGCSEPGRYPKIGTGGPTGLCFDPVSVDAGPVAPEPIATSTFLALPGEERVPVARQSETGLDGIRAEGSGAFVSLLRPAIDTSEHHQMSQALVILTAAGDARVTLDLGSAGRSISNVKLHLHVLEGEVVISLKGAGGTVLSEHRVAAGPPMYGLDFDGNGANTLVIQSAGDNPAKLLIHRIECLEPRVDGNADGLFPADAQN